ncbi:MAG: HAD-IC family P-type ATPase [bacterium]|nr:HAD-IC family P-type ATPase [bacterium]
MEKTGLSSQEVGRRHLKFGSNKLPESKPPSPFFILFNQFKNPLIYVLVAAVSITVFLRDFKDAAVILFAILINVLLGFVQEYRAQKALAALKNILTPRAQVLRDGQVEVILAKELVPGDIVILATGEKIPADGRLLEAVELTVEEAILTGESAPVLKFLSERENKVYMGTTILTGHGKMEVTGIGLLTKIGEVAGLIIETKEVETPLQKKLSQMAQFLAIFVGFLALTVLIFGLLAGKGFNEMFTVSVALAVAAIPEGLVVALTAILAVGMQRILKRKALVRRLLAAETLGSVTVICTDKTGTLTEGRFKVVSWEVNNSEMAIKLAVLCNNLADSEEKALWEYVLVQDHFDPQKIREENPRLDEIPFTSDRKFMASLNEVKDPVENTSRRFLFVKGAPEAILKMCKLTSSRKKEWEEKAQNWGAKGERVLGMGYKKVASGKWQVANRKSKDQNKIEDLVFLGLVGFSDPPREETKEVLRIAREAGIKIKVLTGDFRATAETVLQKIGIEVSPEEILEGEELKHLSPEELRNCVSKIKLFARIDPSEKLRIVQALQENGEVVALVGDGVNDAPALKRAEVGVVVGEASEVAKETADIILLDSNLRTLVASVEEGRGIFDNLRKVIAYLLADSLGAVGVVTGTLFISFFSGIAIPLPLTAAQILWINLISDGFPNLALTLEPKEKGIMREPPRKAGEPLINLQIRTIILVVSFFSALSALLVFGYFLITAGNLELARSVVFGVLGINTLFYVFSCRSLRHPIFKMDFFGNPYLLLAVFAGLALQIIPFYLPSLREFLNLVPLGLGEWMVVLVISLLVVLNIELVKWISNKT